MTSAMTYNSLVSDLQDYLDRTDTRLQNQIPNFITLGEIRCAREVKNLGLKTSVVSVMLPGQCVYLKPNRWLETISINYGSNEIFNVVLRQNTGGFSTITTSTPHGFVSGDTINVAEVSGSNFNGTFVVSSSTQLTVTYTSGGGTQALASTAGYVFGPLENRTRLYPRSLEFCNEYWPDRTLEGAPKFYADYDYNNWLFVATPEIAHPFEAVIFQRPDPLSDTNQTNWFTQYARDLLLYACLLETAPYLKNDQRIPVWKEYYQQSLAAIKTENKERINDSTIKRNDA